MNEKFLIQTDDLLLAGIFWDSSDTRIFPALLSSLACSTLKVAAFFAPPGPNPDEACFFVPDTQMDLLLRFCRRLRRQTGSGDGKDSFGGKRMEYRKGAENFFRRCRQQDITVSGKGCFCCLL